MLADRADGQIKFCLQLIDGRGWTGVLLECIMERGRRGIALVIMVLWDASEGVEGDCVEMILGGLRGLRTRIMVLHSVGLDLVVVVGTS